MSVVKAQTEYTPHAFRSLVKPRSWEETRTDDGRVKADITEVSQHQTLSPIKGAAGVAAPAAEAHQSVNGVVAQVGQTSCVVEILREDGSFEVQFPRSLFAPEIAIPGQPVSIRMGQESGYRVPVIAARVLVPQQEPELDFFEEWASRL